MSPILEIQFDGNNFFRNPIPEFVKVNKNQSEIVTQSYETNDTRKWLKYT